MTEGRRDQNAAVIYSAIVRAAVIAAVFSLIVLGLMLANHFSLQAADPRNSSELKDLKIELHKHPRDENIKARVRAVDLRLRMAYMKRLDFANTGGYILLIGIAGFLIAVPAAAMYRRKIVLPGKEIEWPEEMRRSAVLGRRAVAVFGVIVVGGFGFLAITSRGDLSMSYKKAVRDYEKNPPPNFRTPAPSNPLAGLPAAMLQNLVGRPTTTATPTATSSTPTVAPAQVPPPTAATGNLPTPIVRDLQSRTHLPGFAIRPPAPGPRALPNKEAAFDKNDYAPSAEDVARNWPVFRGPACGVVGGEYPSKWNGQTGEGLLWKTEIPVPGWNSPIVWKDRVFVAGANAKKREIWCIDAANGKVLWKQPVKLAGKQPEVSKDTGFAAPTMAADGRRVFAIFPTGDVVCCDFKGRRLWGRNLGSLESMYGYASSLTMFRSLLIVQYDQGSGDDGKSALIALQGATGKIVWRTTRPVANSWSSPIVAGNRVITCANPWTMAYDALSGKEIWRANLLNGDVAPSPAYADGMAYVCNSGAVLAAIRMDGHGDVTKSHVAWQATDGLPDITSPATNGQLLFLVTTDGTITCYDAKEGKKLWEHSLDTPVRASPVIVGNRVFILDAGGLMHIIPADRSFKEEAKSPIGEKAHATPAFVDGRIYIRGVKHVFCIGAK